MYEISNIRLTPLDYTNEVLNAIENWNKYPFTDLEDFKRNKEIILNKLKNQKKAYTYLIARKKNLNQYHLKIKINDYKLKFNEDVSYSITVLICKDEYGDKLSLCYIKEKALKLRELFHKKAKDSDIFLNLDYTDSVKKALDEWSSMGLFNNIDTVEKKIKTMLNQDPKVTGIFLQKKYSLSYELFLKIGHLDISDPNLWKNNYFILEESIGGMELTSLSWCDENEDSIISLRTILNRPFKLKELYKKL